MVTPALLTSRDRLTGINEGGAVKTEPAEKHDAEPVLGGRPATRAASWPSTRTVGIVIAKVFQGTFVPCTALTPRCVKAAAIEALAMIKCEFPDVLPCSTLRRETHKPVENAADGRRGSPPRVVQNPIAINAALSVDMLFQSGGLIGINGLRRPCGNASDRLP